MGGWGEEKGDPADVLADAVRRWSITKATKDEERMIEALNNYEHRTNPHYVSPSQGSFEVIR